MSNKHNRAHSQLVGQTPVSGKPSRIKDISSNNGTVTPDTNLERVIASHIPHYDAQYLKRLLFIKAAIDQESTKDIFSVPITQ